jgi:hypothetical protein
VIGRQPQGLEILSRDADTANVRDDKHSGDPLLKDFFKVIKGRGSRK